MRATSHKKLRRYQWEAVLFLIDQIQTGRRTLGLNCPTGGGKTMIATILLLMGGRRLFRGAVVAAPSLQAEGNFYKDFDFTVDPKHIPYSTTIMSRRQVRRKDLFHRAREQDGASESMFRAYLSGVPEGEPWTYLTTHAQLVQWGTGNLPEDLTGQLLVLDEAHHAGTEDEGKEDTKIGI